MKIVNRDTFLKMPTDTLYSKYRPVCFDELNIFVGASGDVDFFYQDISAAVLSDSSGDTVEILVAAEKTGHSIALDLWENTSRDGLYDEDQLFAVWEDHDVLDLIERLKICVHGETP